ncbi:hypothetical protein [Streptomyces sp. Tu 4128]|uniref:hypothetical protein n=1 Tax=Streptomyces sp. Tu 4128 TaxID=1120314 RepID=UPI0013CEF2E2|nr:hypothetical protein [Streptomyces sp. Tu 4128]
MATPTRTAPDRAPYDNWRPPIVGVSLLVPIGADCIAVADLRGMLMLPTGGLHEGQTLHEAARRVLTDPSGELQLLRRVTVDRVQTRRRKVITHVMAAAPLTHEAVPGLVYRDPRATIRVIPTMQFLDQTCPEGKRRLLISLQALATGEAAAMDGGVVRAAAPGPRALDARVAQGLPDSTGQRLR